MRLRGPALPHPDLALQFEIIGSLLEAGRAWGFALWCEGSRLGIRQCLQGNPDHLPWHTAAELAIAWRLFQRAAAVLAPARKPAARQQRAASANRKQR